MPPPQTPLAAPTLYLGYGSNLWLHQMATRCPASPYRGIARLPHYTWLINERGYANVVAAADNTWTRYSDVVYGLVYALTPGDETRLDRNEGVPEAYGKEVLECEFWAGTSGGRVDVRVPPERREMLVYVDRERVVPGRPREEYVYRMNRGIEDAVKLGVPEEYVRDVMRVFIPEEDEETDAKDGGIEEFAKTQAAQFRDESGVINETCNS